MTRDDVAVADILLAARRAVAFLGTLDQLAFERDDKTQSAILHQLLIIGEATKRVSDAFRVRHSQIPWRLMAGMRDKLVHEYDDVDLDEVWNTVSNDLPKLIAAVERLVPPEP